MSVGIESTNTDRLVMRGIKKAFGATQALRGVEIHVRPGEVHALVGENGAGKSTLMKVLSGAHKADAGEMFLDGKPFEPANPLDARRQGVAMIYQELSLAPHLTVMENIFLGVEPTRRGLLDWKTLRRKAEDALAQLRTDEIRPDVEVSRLSIANQQMVEIARALALDAKVVVLDEPTSSLTQRDVRRLFDLISRLKAQGLSIVYISHFLEEVQEISDRFTVLRDGETVGTGITAETSADEIVTMMVGREVSDLYPHSQREFGEVLLELDGLCGIEKPKDARLTLRRGEILGIAGLVGAGRTELMRAVFGLDPVVSGKVSVAGNTQPATPALRWRQGVGMVSEDRKAEGLALELSIADNVTLPKLDGLGPWRLVTPGRQAAASRRWIDAIPIKCRSPFQSVVDLSGGNQQKVAIARLLHAEVDVLLLDEPTRGIDVGAKAQIYRLIDELAKGDPAEGRKPKAVLMVSSYLPELMGLCDTIAVMCRGRIADVRPTAEWTEHELMLAATGQQQ
ncbi:sugar ABC transporter ATP-binding protein [Thermostilla marina]